MPSQQNQDPSGYARPVAPGRVEKQGNNSGIVVGETKTTAGTEVNDQYKTEFVKVYQDAGVVGVAMLTLLVLCLLLGLFCSRLIKMYIALTNSRDMLETTRTQAVEKLATNMLVMRSELTTALGELRREHDSQTLKLDGVLNQINTNYAGLGPAAANLAAIHEICERIEKDSAVDRQKKLERMEELLERNSNRRSGEPA